MPQRNFCDRCTEEIPIDAPYYLAQITITNEDHSHAHRSDQYRIPNAWRNVQAHINMMCRKCAEDIARCINNDPPVQRTEGNN